MSLVESDTIPLSPSEQRRLAISKKLFEHNVSAATTMRIVLGAEGILDPSTKESRQNLFKHARLEALKEMGVLDQDGKVIPGQEEFVDTKMVSY